MAEFSWVLSAHPLHSNSSVSVGWIFFSVLIVGLPLYACTGQYNGLTRYVGSAALYRLGARNALLVVALISIGVITPWPSPPTNSWILLWLILTALTGAFRFALRDLLLSMRSTQHKKQLRVAIYGAGEAGAQLAAALRLAGNHKIITFLDDNPAYWSRSINGIAIRPPQILFELEESIDQVLLAIPSLPRSERRRIVDLLRVESQFCRYPLLMILLLDAPALIH